MDLAASERIETIAPFFQVTVMNRFRFSYQREKGKKRELGRSGDIGEFLRGDILEALNYYVTTIP